MALHPLVADVVDLEGNALFGATVRVRDADTLAPVTGFEDPDGATPVSDVLTGPDGQAVVWLEDGDYEWQAEHSSFTSDWLPFKTEPRPTDKGCVEHGADASVARPAGYGSVEWIGSVQPTNAVDGDTWVDTSGP